MAKFADAEAARRAGYTFTWEDDWDLPDGSHAAFYGPGSAYDPAEGGSEPDTCEACVVRDPSGDIVGSLGCIDDADDAYRKTIEDDLARDIEIPTRRAYRVGRTVARAAFEHGDGVLVSESEHGPYLTVGPDSQVITRESSWTWYSLTEAVDGWGKRQTFYVLATP